MLAEDVRLDYDPSRHLIAPALSQSEAEPEE